MAITEVTQFKTDDGEIFDTLQDAQKHELRQNIIIWILRSTGLDSDEAGDLAGMLLRDFVLIPRE